MIGSIAMFAIHFDKAGMIFTAIFRGAFGLKSVAGGIVGSGIRQAMIMGMKRGVFSNEAGLGSSVMVHSSSNVKEPVQQGMWGIFEVFADTIVVCTQPDWRACTVRSRFCNHKELYKPYI